jgi:hypothetical protein
MSLLTLEDARLRGAALPADDGVAQDIIDEQEAWFARRIGLLVGERDVTFYVGIGRTTGKLALPRFTDAVDLTDGGVAVDPDHVRLVDNGSAVHHTYSAASQVWAGPYVVATFTPNDEDEVRSAVFGLVSLAAQPIGPYESEQIGAYSYRRGGASGTLSMSAQKAQLVASLTPVHDSETTLHANRRLGRGDPVINRPELPV